MTAALVGPLPTIRFWDGTRIAYEPPRNTLDKRYPACRDHHPACDCREAHFAEDRAEHQAEMREIKRAAAEVLAGHVTYAFTADGKVDYARRCSCTGCQIARRTGVRDVLHQMAEGVAYFRPAGWEPPQ